MKNKKKCQKKKEQKAIEFFVNSTIWSFLQVLAFFVLFLSIFCVFFICFLLATESESESESDSYLKPSRKSAYYLVKIKNWWSLWLDCRSRK